MYRMSQPVPENHNISLKAQSVQKASICLLYLLRLFNGCWMNDLMVCLKPWTTYLKELVAKISKCSFHINTSTGLSLLKSGKVWIYFRTIVTFYLIDWLWLNWLDFN